MLLVCDLDGVVWRGQQLIGSPGGLLRELVESGNELVFLTNNSFRPAALIAERLVSIIGSKKFGLITSPMAVASLIDPGSRAWVLGEEGLVETLRDSGIDVDVSPGEADYVVTGLTRDFDYESIVSATNAIRAGAKFIAANVDPTYPTERGPMPGAGPLVAAIECAAGVEATVAGKPSLVMSALVRARAQAHAEVVLIGDRIDQDYGTAVHLGCEFILIDENSTDEHVSAASAGTFSRRPSLVDALGELIARLS